VTNPYGGSATHYAGYGTTATGAYGGTAYHASGAYYHRRPPRTIRYHSAHYRELLRILVRQLRRLRHRGRCGRRRGGGRRGRRRDRGLGQHRRRHVERLHRRWSPPVARTPPRVTSNAYSAGLVAGSANTASVYNAGVAAGSATTTAAYNAGAAAAIAPHRRVRHGRNLSDAACGLHLAQVQGMTYYLCGNTWFQPSYGAERRLLRRGPHTVNE